MNQPLQSSRLGRGLASLIGEVKPARGEAQSSTGAAGPLPEGEHRLVAVDRVHPGRHNPRRTFAEDELAELAISIKENGIIQPITVRPDAQSVGHFEIVAGERRWRAARLAGLTEVPVVVHQMTDQQAHEWALIENVQRADLNAIEEALGYRELNERFQYSQEQISEKIGKSRSHVANTLRLLRLPEAVQALVQMGQLTAGHARALIGREDAAGLAERIIAENLNVREVEALVQGGGGSVGGDGGAVIRKPRDKDPDTRAFERELTDLLGLKVEIKRGSGESGNLVIKYGNFDQLEWIRMRLTGGHG